MKCCILYFDLLAIIEKLLRVYTGPDPGTFVTPMKSVTTKLTDLGVIEESCVHNITPITQSTQSNFMPKVISRYLNLVM